MSPIVFLSVTMSRRRRLTPFARRGSPAVVVTLHGEHDLTTRPEIAEVMAQAIAAGDADVVIDLSRVEFMDAATVGVILCARELLRARSRALVVRAPSPCARRVLELSGLIDVRSVAPPPIQTAVAPGALAMPGANQGAEGQPLAI